MTDDTKEKQKIEKLAYIKEYQCSDIECWLYKNWTSLRENPVLVENKYARSDFNTHYLRGVLCNLGLFGMEKNLNMAMKFYQLAGEKHIPSLNNIGYLIANNKMPGYSPTDGLSYFKRAVDGHLVVAMKNLQYYNDKYGGVYDAIKLACKIIQHGYQPYDILIGIAMEYPEYHKLEEYKQALPYILHNYYCDSGCWYLKPGSQLIRI